MTHMVPLSKASGNDHADSVRRHVAGINRHLAALGELAAGLEERTAGPVKQEVMAMPSTLLDRALAEISIRKTRALYFREGLFAEPAWDMLLDLFVARLRNQNICVTSLCIAAGVPSTTALRWVRSLEKEGLLSRLNDPDDRRRVLVQLTEGAFDAVRASLLSANGHGR